MTACQNRNCSRPRRSRSSGVAIERRRALVAAGPAVPMISAEPAHPRDAARRGVPDQREHGRRAGAPGRSPAARRSWSNQWKACAARPPRRPTRRRSGMCSAAATTWRDVGQPLAQHGEHLRVGVGGEHVVAERDQHLGQLAGAGPLEDRRAEPDRPASSGYDGRGPVVGVGHAGRRTVRGAWAGSLIVRSQLPRLAFAAVPRAIEPDSRPPIRWPGWPPSRACRRRSPRPATAST